jgi:hypothetical protein
MAIEVGSYNPKDITLIVGTESIESFFQDTTVDIEKVEDDHTATVGLNGNVIYNESNNNMYTLTISLLPGSANDNFLRGLRAAKTTFPCLYENPSGERMTLVGCRFQKNATKTDGAEVGAREWVIMIADGQDIT